MAGYQFALGQIKTTKVASEVKEVPKAYDSLSNFLEDRVKLYIDQELYLNKVSESLREYGYSGFIKNFKKSTTLNRKNIYKCCDGTYNSKYSELAGRYFKVLNVIEHPKAKETEAVYGDKYFLHLQDKETKEECYFEYDSRFEHSFPFITVGYYEKQRIINQGRQFVVRGKNWISSTSPMTDINTGKEVSLEPGDEWKCIDLTIEERFYTLSLILQNQEEESIVISIRNSNNQNFLFDLADAREYKQKFGDEKWTKILEGKVIIGFTEEMVKLAWGEPDEINRSSQGPDQWVYDNQYLYLENGILKSFN